MIINNYDTEKLWAKVKELNELSHMYSEQADLLVHTIQEMEEDNENQDS